MKLNKIDMSHVDIRPLDEILDSEEFKNEVDNYKYDKSHLGEEGVTEEDLVEHNKTLLEGYGI